MLIQSKNATQVMASLHALEQEAALLMFLVKEIQSFYGKAAAEEKHILQLMAVESLLSLNANRQ